MNKASNSTNTKAKLETLLKQLAGSEDFVCKSRQAIDGEIRLYYFDSLVDQQYLDQYILPRIAEEKVGDVGQRLMSYFQAENISDQTVDEISLQCFEGKILFQVEEVLLSILAADLPKRIPEESSHETSIRGPKDGFVEDLKTNISLIRRRLPTSSLCLEKYTIGARSNTKIALLYVKDIIDPRVLDELHRRLERIEVDVLLSIYELESFVRDRPYSVFPSMSYSGRPDMVVQALNQGRFALIVDGNPTVSFAPVNLLLQTKSPEDNDNNYAYVSIERVLRMVGIMVSGFLPGTWIAFSAFNIEQIPYLLVATISVSRFGLPMSAPIEMFIILLLFELFNEAGVRLPQAIGQTVAVLGGLIVGDAAIRAGLTSPTMLVVAAITYISSFTLVNQSLVAAITVVRFVVIILSTFFGLFGVIIAFILIVIYFATLSSFGVPYFGSLAPLNLREFLKAFFKAPRSLYFRRAKSNHPGDLMRGGRNED